MSGQVKEITSLANPVVKDLKALHLKKHRDQSGTFLAEGMKLVLDALETGWDVKTFIHARTARDKDAVARAAAKAHARGATVLEVPEKVLTAITRRDNPQAVIAEIAQRYQPLATLKPKPGQTIVALDRVRDPGNLGTIIRTADAAGASAVILVGECTDVFSTEAVRATMGSIFAMPVARASESEFLAWVRASGAYTAGTHLEGSVDYRTVDYGKKPTVLLMGNEQQGLTPALTQGCGVLVRIPQAGQADSLNLAIATGIMLFEARRALLTLEAR